MTNHVAVNNENKHYDDFRESPAYKDHRFIKKPSKKELITTSYVRVMKSVWKSGDAFSNKSISEKENIIKNKR